MGAEASSCGDCGGEKKEPPSPWEPSTPTRNSKAPKPPVSITTVEFDWPDGSHEAAAKLQALRRGSVARKKVAEMSPTSKEKAPLLMIMEVRLLMRDFQSFFSWY
jgi:hypothetical protein